MSQVAAVSAADWDKEVLQATVPVLVDFGAAWCPPCRRVAPEVDAVAAEMAGRAKVIQVDVDAEPEIAARYGVQRIPALLIFKAGTVVDQSDGFQPRGRIAERLAAHAS
jgi:thioredoxin 1